MWLRQKKKQEVYYYVKLPGRELTGDFLTHQGERRMTGRSRKLIPIHATSAHRTVTEKAKETRSWPLKV